MSGAARKSGICGCRERDRKSTRLNSSHLVISYAVFCLKKKKNIIPLPTLGYVATPLNQILKPTSHRELRLRLGTVSVDDVLASQPGPHNLSQFILGSL